MYGKHFASTYTGSMVGAGPCVFAVWGYVIANTVKGRVELNPVLLSMMLGGTVEGVQGAIDFLCSPDTRSRNKDHGGRRLIREGEYQYLVTGHERYRKILNEDERREYNRIKKAESRSKGVKEDVNDMSAVSAHTEAEAEADTDKRKRVDKSTPESISPESFLQHWNQYESLPTVRALSKERRSKIKARGKSGVIRDNWKEIVRKLSESPFHTGSNDRGWRATVDWLLKNDENCLKILELPELMDGATGPIDEDDLDRRLGVGK